MTKPSSLHSTEAEKAVLGCCLLEPKWISDVRSELRPTDFHLAEHQIIFSTMCAMIDRGDDVEPKTVTVALEECGKLLEVGGQKAVLELEASVLTTQSLPSHVRFVREYAGKRLMTEAYAEAANRIAKGDDVAEVQAYIEAQEAKIAPYFRTTHDSWEKRTLATAFAPRPPIDWVIDKLFASASLSAVVGPSGCHKTNLLMDIACVVAGGKNFLVPHKGGDAVAFATTRGPVLWINQDSPTRMIDERFEAFARGHELSEDAPIEYYSFPNPPLNATNETHMAALRQRIEKCGARLVVIDCLQTVKGDTDENSSEMAQVIIPFRRIAESCDCAVVLIHHVNKGGGYRGSTAIENLIDNSFNVKREASSNDIIVSPGKMRGAVVPSFGASFVYEANPQTGELTWAAFKGFKVTASDDVDEVQSAVFEFLRESPGSTQTKIAKAVRESAGAGVNAVRDVVRTMTSKGYLTERSGARNSKCYTISDAWEGAR